MRTIGKYVLPQSTVQLIEALNHPTRQAIIVLLHEVQEYSFSEIQKTLGIEKHDLNFHLKKLLAANLINRATKLGTAKQKYSFYTITPLGSQLLASLASAQTSSTQAKKLKT